MYWLICCIFQFQLQWLSYKKLHNRILTTQSVCPCPSPATLPVTCSLSPPSPPHFDPITLPFLSNINQITVTFTDLTAGILYNYTIRIVLASDQSNDILPTATGIFSLALLEGIYSCMYIQWNPSITDTIREQCFGLYTEVAFVERLFCTQTVHLGPGCL